MKLMIFLLLCVLLLWRVQGKAEAGVLSPEPEQRAEYWLERLADKDKVLLNEQARNALNRRLGGVDFAAYPDRIEGDELTEKIKACHEWLLEKESYNRAGLVTEEAKERLVTACNLRAIADGQPVRWAVTVRRCNLRNLPTQDCWAEEPGNWLFDRLQGTALDPAEPVALLSESADGKMFFAQSRNYHGWVEREAVALATRQQLLAYAQPQAFLVVTTNRVSVAGELYQLGATLPLRQVKADGWTVTVPVADREGRLREKTAQVKRSASFHQGWLPCTRGNLLRMGFTCLGDKYDWGGMTDSVDCSSFVGNVYRTVGIELPRDADEQEEAAPLSLDFAEAEDRLELLRHAAPGDLLFRDGHVMLYLGEGASGPAILHAFSRCQEDGKEVARRRVAVTSAAYTLGSGESNLDALTTAGKYLE